MPGTTPSSPLLDRKAAAAYLGQSERWLEERWQRREIPAVKVGRKMLFRIADLDLFIETHRVEPVTRTVRR